MEKSKGLEQPLVPKKQDDAKALEESIEQLKQSTYLEKSWLSLLFFGWVSEIVNVKRTK